MNWHCRCNTSTQFEAYASLNHYIYEANETEIFILTGCLSSCDKYEYAVQPLTNLRSRYIMKKEISVTDVGSITGCWDCNTLILKFVITTGRVEEKEQVI